MRRYLVGLLFTLKTHSHLFENPEEEEGEGGGHEVPDAWSHTHTHTMHTHLTRRTDTPGTRVAGVEGRRRAAHLHHPLLPHRRGNDQGTTSCPPPLPQRLSLAITLTRAPSLLAVGRYNETPPYKAIEPTLDAIGIEQAFAGATVMALVPSSAEVRGPSS